MHGWHRCGPGVRLQFGLPVVFLSAYSANEVLAQAKLSEPFGYILKPFSEREWRGVIEMALYKHTADARLRQSAAALALSHYVGVTRDSTERCRQEAELVQHRDHLEQLVASRTAALASARERADAANQAKIAFLSRMSHELRTPLHAVIGYAQLVISDPGTLPARAESYIQRVADDVLELARIESNMVSIALVPVALDSLVRDAVSFVEPMTAKAGLQLEVDLAPVVAVADPTRLRQVLLNLLSNAVKYNVAAGSVRVTLQADGGQAYLAVADTGMGMTAAQLAGLFEPFNRLGREHSGVEGTRIGPSPSRWPTSKACSTAWTPCGLRM